ncbi:MAG: response regulator [Methanophagales archaeon]|nr:response regulator [Methanophagales archaeon]
MNPCIRNCIALFWRGQGILHSVIASAYDGEEAVEIYKELNERPDIIIMDHRMPRKNGIEATKEILQINSGAKIVFLSADDRVKEKAYAAGACSFRLKSFGMAELIEEIESAL